MISYNKPNELSELIIQISARPALFCGWNDYSKVASFIEGYVYARKQFGETHDMEILKAFSLWLSEKLERPKNWVWSLIIEDYYKDSEVALKNLPILFNEFLNKDIKDI